VQAALLGVVEEGDAGGDQDGLALAEDEAFPQEAGQVEGAAQAVAAVGGDVEAEQVGDRPGADQGRPVAADGRVVGVVGGVPVGGG
jgi:hypothetical protein